MIQHHIKSGIIRLTEAKAVFQTKLDTKSPKTTLKIDVKIIITIDGSTNLNNFFLD